MTAHMIKRDLAYAYRILGYLKLDDHTYTHLSARQEKNSFFIYPFGMLFSEVSPDSLMHVTLEGEILEGQEEQYNETGYCIHGHIYKARPDVQAIFHLHTPASVAVSALEEGLLPLSQWALHFYGKVAYHAYDSLILEKVQGKQLVTDLGHQNVMLLRGHGLLTCGKTLPEALFYAYHLEKACQTQCLTLSMNQPYLLPSEAVCQKAVQTLLSFEKDLGRRDWNAWIRFLQSELNIIF